MVNSNFTIHIILQHFMFKNKKLNMFNTDNIDKIKDWYRVNTEHFFKSSHITCFDIYHIKDNIFMINFSYDTITLPFIEENLTNPDIFGKNPIQLGDEKYFIIGRKYDELELEDITKLDNEFSNLSELDLYS